MTQKYIKTTIGDFIQFEYGKGLPESKRINGTVPVYGSNGIVGFHNKSLIKGKGIIIGRKGTIGHIEWAENDFWPIDTTYYIRERKDYNLRWLYFCLQSLSLKSLNRATGVPGLNRLDVYKIIVQLPDLSAQEKISDILNTVDHLILNTVNIIHTVEILKQGLIHDFFIKNIDLWKVQKLGDITNFIDYRGKTPKKVNAGIPLITAKNVKMGFIHINPQEYISKEDYPVWMTRGIPKKGDVLFTTEAPLGNVATLDTDEKVAFAQRIIIMQPKDSLNSIFLKYLLMSDFVQERILSLSSGGTVKGIKAKVLKQIELPIPSEVEQEEISRSLLMIDLKLQSEKTTKSLLEKFKSGLMKDIFNQKVEIN